MELLDLYDEDGRKLGSTIKRGEKPKNGYVMLSIVFIKNSYGKYLIQKTSDETSDEKGSKYSSTGGHVTHNEDGISTIICELKEELGLNIVDDELQNIALVKHPKGPCIINLYLINKDIDINTLKLQTEEVESVMWMSNNEIISLIKEDKFLGSHGYLFEKYFIN